MHELTEIMEKKVYSRKRIPYLFVFATFPILLVPLVLIFIESLYADAPAAKVFWFVAPFGLAALCAKFYHFLKSGYEIEIDQNQIKFIDFFGRSRQIDPQNIIAIKQSILNKYDCSLIWQDKGKKYSVLLNSELNEFGSLIEKLLEVATECKRVNISKIVSASYGGSQVWQKEPNGNIINAAIQRAEQNRLKKAEEVEP